jgi:hypothetical protein
MAGIKPIKRAEMKFEAYCGPPGDVIWIPKKTPIVHEGGKATVGHALHPVEWRKRHGLA